MEMLTLVLLLSTLRIIQKCTGVLLLTFLHSNSQKCVAIEWIQWCNACCFASKSFVDFFRMSEFPGTITREEFKRHMRNDTMVSFACRTKRDGVTLFG